MDIFSPWPHGRHAHLTLIKFQRPQANGRVYLVSIIRACMHKISLGTPLGREWKSAVPQFYILHIYNIKNSDQLMAGPLSCRHCPSISRNNEKKMTPTSTMSILFLNGCGSYFVFNGFIPKNNQIIRNI